MDATNNIAEDLFYKIRSRFSGLKLGSETGEITINPEEARFFDFDYMEDETPIGHVSISIAEPNSMKIYFSHGITESMDPTQRKTWYGFLRELRKFAKRRLLNFDTRDIAKDNLDKRDYEFLAQNSKTKTNAMQAPVGESIMNESAMYGTKTVSYQKLMDTRLIIKHSQAVMDDTQPGARTRHISALFVENQEGERFKYPFIHLAGARAMQRHVANGGLPYDSLGKNIISMSEQIAQLKSFGNYVVRNDLMNSETNSIVERSSQALNDIRETIQKLSKQSYYENYKANFQEQQPVEVPQDFVNDLTEKFTVKNFKEDIKSVFPFIYRLMQEESNIDYDDIVEMTTDLTNEDIEIDLTPDEIDPFSKFENWVMEVENASPIDSEDPEEQQLAIKKLQDLMLETFPVGTNGENAISSLEEIIKDPELIAEIKNLSKEDPNADARPLVKSYLELKAPEVLDQIDFGDLDQTQEEPVAADQEEVPAADQAQAPAQQPQMADVDREESPKRINVQELAEFIQSFYDKQSGTFPKGPEGVCVMVGKKFGEQAEHVARKFVERMAPQQEEGAEKLEELTRMRELAGLQKEADGYSPNQHPQTTDYGIGDENDDEDQNKESEKEVKEAQGAQSFEVEGYEIETTVTFDRDESGNPINIRVMLGDADITETVDPSELKNIASDIEPDWESPWEGNLTTVNLEVGYSASGADRPASRYEPPEYADYEIEGVAVVGNGNEVEIDVDSLGKDARADFEQQAKQHDQNREPDFQEPYEDRQLEDIVRLSGISKGIGL